MPFEAKWSLTSQLPSANLVLIFDGMMALSERTEPSQFEFLCHGESPGGTQSHDLKVKIDGNPLDDANKFREFEFYVLDKDSETPTDTNPIGVYTPNPLNAQAFSHLVDLEQVYKKELKKRSPLKVANRINIKNGTLYTSKLSEYEFSLVDETGTEIMKPRQTATELSINISLANNEIGVLKWSDGNQENFQQFDNQENHIIYFNNDCSDDSTPNGKCKDSDFPLNFENIIDDSSIIPCDLKKYINTMSDDDKPCSSSGYGGSNGWEYP